jgi:phenylalanyl-tRNA synthetase beta chain
MKFSWKWLSDFVDLGGLDPYDVAKRFTECVAELEGVEKVGDDLEDVVCGVIKRIERHPDADRLVVCNTDVGGRTITIVSGAPNLREGMAVAVALPGAKLKTTEIKATEIKGVLSAGMVASEAELGIGDDASKVLELPSDSKPGTPIAKLLDLEDFIFEVDNKAITNRPDLWGHLGIAREISALYSRTLEKPSCTLPQAHEDILKVIVDDPNDCPRYMAVAFKGIKITKSPFFVANRLRNTGIKPINNVVDASNYVMMALGEPTHAFDRMELLGQMIRVRRAYEGERFVTLDGTELTLSQEDLVIADAERPVALAGVVGGQNSGIRDDTREVVLECATFNPARIRKTSVRHGVRTDSSSRFEKALDPHLPPLAVSYFFDILRLTCPDCKPISRVYDCQGFDPTPKVITLDCEYVSRRLGVEVPRAEQIRILTALEFQCKEREGGKLDCVVPSFRATRDVSIQEDLVEEVGRFIGYGKIKPQKPVVIETLHPKDPMLSLLVRIRKILSLACGMDEVYTYSFYSENLLSRIAFDPDAPRLKNFLSSDNVRLRTSLLPNLLGVLEKNARFFDDFAVYEMGRVFFKEMGDGGVLRQPQHLGLLLYRKQDKGKDGTLVLRMKGIIEVLLQKLGKEGVLLENRVESGLPFLHPARTIAIEFEGAQLGLLGMVHPLTMQSLDCQGSAVLAELDLDMLMHVPDAKKEFCEIPRFPKIEHDLSFVVDEDRTLKELIQTALKVAPEFLTKIEFVSEYKGAPIPDGKKSLCIRLVFQSKDRTLSDAEVMEAMERVIEAEKAIGATIRTG